MSDESSDPIPIEQADKETLIEIIQNLSNQVDELERKGIENGGSSGPDVPPPSPSNYLEVDLKTLGVFKMNSPTENNIQLFSNLLAFINGVKKTPINAPAPTQPDTMI